MHKVGLSAVTSNINDLPVVFNNIYINLDILLSQSPSKRSCAMYLCCLQVYKWPPPTAQWMYCEHSAITWLCRFMQSSLTVPSNWWRNRYDRAKIFTALWTIHLRKIIMMMKMMMMTTLHTALCQSLLRQYMSIFFPSNARLYIFCYLYWNIILFLFSLHTQG